MSEETHAGHTQSEDRKPSTLSNILAIIGLIILIVIIIWGIVHLVTLSSGWFSGFFQQNNTPTITVSAPNDATAGAPITLSWTNSSTENGTYAFIYQCQQNFQFDTIDPTTNTANPLQCGTAIALASSTVQSVQVLPLMAPNATSSVSVPVSIVFTQSNGTQTTGNSTLTIHPGSNTPVTQTQTQTPTQPTKPVTITKPTTTYTRPTHTTPADLAVHIIAVGSIDPNTGAFVASPATSPNQVSAVEFSIQNVGGSRSGTYYFSANLPTTDGYIYQSPAQASLAPGSSIVNTLRFTQVTNGGGQFSVSINPGGNVRESNYSNNTAQIFVPAYTYNGYPSGYYQSSGYSTGYYDQNQYYNPYSY